MIYIISCNIRVGNLPVDEECFQLVALINPREYFRGRNQCYVWFIHDIQSMQGIDKCVGSRCVNPPHAIGNDLLNSQQLGHQYHFFQAGSFSSFRRLRNNAKRLGLIGS